MEISWDIRYSSNFAFVDSLLIINGMCMLRQTNGSYRSLAILYFCFDKKKVRITDNGITVETDELDEEFIKYAKAITPNSWRVWKEIYENLRNGSSRREILDQMRIQTISRALKTYSQESLEQRLVKRHSGLHS